MSRVLFIDLIAASLQLKIAELSTSRMTFVVMTNGGMTIEAKRNGVVDVGPVRLNMSHFNADTGELPAKATMSVTPEQDVDLIGLAKFVFSASHWYRTLSERAGRS